MSPDSLYKFVPKNQHHNLLWRRHVQDETAKDRRLQRAFRAYCKADILFYINTFVFQFNPDNLEHEVEPFITFDFQDAAIIGADVEIDGAIVHLWGILECVEDKKDARWPKSRKMGASWVAMMTADWLCIFHTHKAIGVLSRDEDSVDQAGDANSLFWKIDFIHQHLPDWLKGKITKKKMRFLYETTNSFIVGEANTPSAFVSGRATMLIVDEFGQFKNGAETFEMSSDVSYCRIFVFTHKEQSGMAYELCFDAKYKHMREIKTHWTQHPERNKGLYRYDDVTNQIEVLDKTYQFPPDFDFVMEGKPTGGPYPGLRSPWYDNECIRRSERDVAMNLDIDPRGASDKFFDAYRIKILKLEPTCRPPLWTGRLEYNRDTGQPIELVYEPNGLIKMWIHPKSPKLLPEMSAGAGMDVSAGTGMTPSCLSLINAVTGEKVLEYAYALIFANQLAELVVALLRMIKDRRGVHPLLGWETQGSPTFERRVRQLGYGPFYIKADEDATGKPRNTAGRAGFDTHKAVMLPLMEDYRDCLYDGRCVNPSEFALDETLKFVYTAKGGGVEYRGSKKPKRVADEGSGAAMHHGDMVKADAIAWKMVREIGMYMGRFEEEKPDPGWIDPRSLDGRIKLATEQQDLEVVWR